MPETGALILQFFVHAPGPWLLEQVSVCTGAHENDLLMHQCTVDAIDENPISGDVAIPVVLPLPS